MSRPRAGGASLDVLRFLAACFILLFHYASSAPVSLKGNPVLSQGWLATDFFLLLSGYIMMRAYGARLAEGRVRRTQFIVRRFLRLWPSHILVLLAFGAFVAASTSLGFLPKHADRYGVVSFFAEACLVHGWGLLNTPGWNVPTWTLSALLVCYVLFSVYARWLVRLPRVALVAVALVTLAVGHGLALTLAHEAFVDLPFVWGLLRAIPLFLIGTVIARVADDLRLPQGTFWATLGVAFASIIALCFLPRSWAGDSVILSLLAAVLTVSGAVTFPENAVTRRLGTASFALFLVHSLVGAIWFGAMYKLVSLLHISLAGQWALWGVGLCLALSAAFAFDAFVDRPLSRWVSQLTGGKGG